MKLTLSKIGFFAGAAIIGMAAVESSASAASLLNTGVDGTGNLLSPGAVESDWQVYTDARALIGDAVVVSNQISRAPSGIPAAWIPNGPGSQWIAEDVNGLGGVNKTRFYETSFSATLG